MSKIPAILLYSIFTETLYLRQVANKYKSRNMDFQTATLSIITASHFIGYRFEMLRALFVQDILFSIQKLHADNLDMCGNCITHTFLSRVNLQDTFNSQSVSRSFLSGLFRFSAQKFPIKCHTSSTCCLPTERYPYVCRRYTVITTCPSTTGAFYISKLNPI